MEYVLPAVQELSDAQTSPLEIAYDSLLTLAKQVRSRPQLYETSEKESAPSLEHMGWLEPVEPAEIATPEQVELHAKQLVEAFFAAIVDGRDSDAVGMLKYEEPRASQVVAALKQLPDVGAIKIEQMYTSEETALVLTNEFVVFENQKGRLAINLIREKGAWLIKDFDSTSTDRMDEEIAPYLQRFPDAKHFSE